MSYLIALIMALSLPVAFGHPIEDDPPKRKMNRQNGSSNAIKSRKEGNEDSARTVCRSRNSMRASLPRADTSQTNPHLSATATNSPTAAFIPFLFRFDCLVAAV